MSTRKELRQPDALQRAGIEAREWFKERQTVVLVGVLAVVLAGLAAALVSYTSGRKEDKASRDLGAALELLERPVYAGAAPEDAKVFKTQKDKDEATAKAMAEFRDQHKGTRAALTATLTLADADYRLAKYDDALAAYTEYADKTPADDPLRGAAIEGQGYSYEAKGDLPKALSTFERLAREGNGEFLVGMGMFHRGRILAEMGQKEEAAKVFQEIQDAHKDTAAARMASERLTILASQGVKIPAPAARPDAGS